jgi:hypothetical protein
MSTAIFEYLSPGSVSEIHNIFIAYHGSEISEIPIQTNWILRKSLRSSHAHPLADSSEADSNNARNGLAKGRKGANRASER